MSTFAAPWSCVSVTVHSAPVGNGPSVCDPFGVVNVTVAGSNPATGDPRYSQATSAVNTVPSGINDAPGPSSAFDTVSSPVVNVFVTVTSTGP